MLILPYVRSYNVGVRMYNLDFNIAAMIFLVLYYLFLKLTYTTSRITKIFRTLLVVLFFATAFDTLTAETIEAAANIPNWINNILNIVYFILSPAASFTFTLYLDSASGDGESGNAAAPAKPANCKTADGDANMNDQQKQAWQSIVKKLNQITGADGGQQGGDGAAQPTDNNGGAK